VRKNIELTFADVLAAPPSVAPMRLATRVDAAMDIENGIWNVRAVIVASECKYESNFYRI
jgi:hypothetical protein